MKSMIPLVKVDLAKPQAFDFGIPGYEDAILTHCDCVRDGLQKI